MAAESMPGLGERKANVVLAVEQYPCRQSKPGDKTDGGRVDVRVKLVEDGFVVGDKIPGHDSYLLRLGALEAGRT